MDTHDWITTIEATADLLAAILTLLAALAGRDGKE
jgi:hypothetical protein